MGALTVEGGKLAAVADGEGASADGVGEAMRPLSERMGLGVDTG